MHARLSTRFPLTTVDTALPAVACPALRLTGPEARALPFAALSVSIQPTAMTILAQPPALAAPVAAAIELLWADALSDVPREPFLDFCFTALRHLESHGGALCEAALALHRELHPADEGAAAAVPFAAPSQLAGEGARRQPPALQQQQQQRAALAPQPAAAALAACGVSDQGLWSAAAHKAFELALRAVFHCPSPARVTDARAGEQVARAVAQPGATALACQRHFASLAHVVQGWSRARGLAQPPPAEPASAPAPAAAAAAAAAKAPAPSGAKAGRGGAFLELLLQSTAPPEGDSSTREGQAGGATEEVEEGEEGDEYEEEDEHGIVSVQLRRPMLHGVYLTPPPLSDVSYVVDFKGLHLSGGGALVCSLVHLGVTCSRCDTLAHMPLPGAHISRSGCCAAPPQAAGEGAAVGGGGGGGSGAAAADEGEVKQWCSKCSNLLSCRLRAGLIHEGAASLGYIVALNCAAQVASCAELWASCLECGEAHCVPRFTAPGTHEASCQRCHARLKLECREWEVEVRAGGRAPPAAPASIRPGHVRYPAGRPLPERGACSHFKQSYRWLRFPCCGLAFPCPECHDCAQSHPHERAKRMLCGHCSREQPFTNAPCVACGEELRKRAARTAHWEGGEGQRVQALLSSKDRRKFTGRAKVASAKGTRVGTAKARAAAAAALGREAKKQERPGQ